jgi:hypothetical protein
VGKWNLHSDVKYFMGVFSHCFGDDGDEEDENYDKFNPDDYDKCPVCGALIKKVWMTHHMFARNDVDHAVYAVHQS